MTVQVQVLAVWAAVKDFIPASLVKHKNLKVLQMKLFNLRIIAIDMFIQRQYQFGEFDSRFIVRLLAFMAAACVLLLQVMDVVLNIKYISDAVASDWLIYCLVLHYNYCIA